MYIDTDLWDNWIPSDFSIQKLKMKLGFPDILKLKTKDIQMVKNKQTKIPYSQKAHFCCPEVLILKKR